MKRGVVRKREAGKNTGPVGLSASNTTPTVGAARPRRCGIFVVGELYSSCGVGVKPY